MTTDTDDTPGGAYACQVCDKYQARWIRTNTSGPMDPVRLCDTHKKRSEEMNRAGRWAFLPIRENRVTGKAAPAEVVEAPVQPSLLAYPVSAPRGYVGKGPGHETTAQAAQAKAMPRSGTLRRVIADAVLAAGGLSDYELEALTSRSHQSVSGCRNGLVADGWLEDSGITRPNQYGNESKVWIATARLRAERTSSC